MKSPCWTRTARHSWTKTATPSPRSSPLEEPVYYFQTKGDANEDVDGTPVHYKNIVGSPVFSIPLLGYLSSYLQTRKGMIMGISVALVLIILTFLPDLLNWVDDDKNKPKKKPDEDEPAPAPAADAAPAEPYQRKRRSERGN